MKTLSALAYFALGLTIAFVVVMVLIMIFSANMHMIPTIQVQSTETGQKTDPY
jgi:hypothetical protein